MTSNGPSHSLNYDPEASASGFFVFGDASSKNLSLSHSTRSKVTCHSFMAGLNFLASPKTLPRILFSFRCKAEALHRNENTGMPLGVPVSFRSLSLPWANWCSAKIHARKAHRSPREDIYDVSGMRRARCLCSEWTHPRIGAPLIIRSTMVSGWTVPGQSGASWCPSRRRNQSESRRCRYTGGTAQ
jgi:hypothetical protein